MEISKIDLSLDEIKYLEEEENKKNVSATKPAEISIHEDSSAKTPAATDPISIHGDTKVAPEDSVKITKKKEDAKAEEKKAEKSLWQKATGWLFGSCEKTETAKEKSKTEEKGFFTKLQEAILGEDKPANKAEAKKKEEGFWANLKDILFGDETDTQTADKTPSDTTVDSVSNTSNTGNTHKTTNINLNKIKELENKEIDDKLLEKIQNSPSLSAEEKALLRKEIVDEMKTMGINVNELTEEKFDAFVRIMQFKSLDHTNVKERRATLRNETTRENYRQFIANHPELTDDQKKQLERQFNIDGILEKVALNRATEKCTAEQAAEVYLEASKDTEELRKASIEALADEMKKDGVDGDMQEIFVTASENTSTVVLNSAKDFAKSDRCPASFKQKLLDAIKETEDSIKTNSSKLVQTLRERSIKEAISYAKELKEITIKKEKQQEERKVSKKALEDSDFRLWLVARKIYALTCEIIKKMGQAYTVKDQDLKAIDPALFAEWQNALALKDTAYWGDYALAAEGRLLDNDSAIASMNLSFARTRAVILS